MTEILTTRGFEPELPGYRYPRAVQFYEFQDQAQTLRMAYMCAEPESSNQKSVLLLHGKNFSGAYWEPTIRELLREGYEFPLVATKTLLIIGQRDRTGFAGGASENVRTTLGDYPVLGRTAARAFQHAKLVEIAGVGHLPQIEAFDQFSQALLGFVTSEEG